METYVFQMYELLDKLEFLKEDTPFIILGHGLGAAIGAGFVAKYPKYAQSLVLISPAGLKWNKNLLQEDLFTYPFIGESLWRNKMTQKSAAKRQIDVNFWNSDNDSDYYYLIQRDLDMIKWQLSYTPGYLASLNSTIKHFPLGNSKLVDLYTSLGDHPSRDVCVIWGIEDECCNAEECIEVSKSCFPRAKIVVIKNAGHRVCIENFHDAADAILAFVSVQSKKLRRQLRGYN